MSTPSLAITPMVLLCGVFFPVTQLPPLLQQVSALLPLTHAIDLVRPLVNGEIPQRRWLFVGFPNSWFYDVVRVLDYLRSARTEPDPRTAEALDIVESKRDSDGRWPLDHRYHEDLLVDFGDVEGQPSRWITLRAMRVLRWAGTLDRTQAAVA